MYANVNVKTKTELRKRVAAGEKIGVHQVGPFGGSAPQNGKTYLEGPWYPRPHTWYAEVTLQNGHIVKVK